MKECHFGLPQEDLCQSTIQLAQQNNTEHNFSEEKMQQEECS
jgi:hypothetical protein